jgi:hypothetical protein
MTSAQAPTWQNPRILLILFLIFLSGLIVGMAAMSLGAHRWLHESAAPRSASSRDAAKDVTLHRFKTELNLSPQQTEQLDTILDDFFAYYHTLQSQMDDVRQSGKERIRHILTPEQQSKFDKMVTEFQQPKLPR